MVRLGRERFRCTYVAIDPPVRRPNPVREVDHGEPTTICRGGVVRNDKCICPRGASVLKGVCRPTSGTQTRPRRISPEARRISRQSTAGRTQTCDTLSGSVLRVGDNPIAG